MVELYAKILQIICTAFEEYVPQFCRLCKNYAHIFCSFVLLIVHILEIKSTYKLTHTKSDYSANN